jgi:hypothetical protein
VKKMVALYQARPFSSALPPQRAHQSSIHPNKIIWGDVLVRESFFCSWLMPRIEFEFPQIIVGALYVSVVSTIPEK